MHRGGRRSRRPGVAHRPYAMARKRRASPHETRTGVVPRPGRPTRAELGCGVRDGARRTAHVVATCAPGPGPWPQATHALSYLTPSHGYMGGGRSYTHRSLSRSLLLVAGAGWGGGGGGAAGGAVARRALSRGIKYKDGECEHGEQQGGRFSVDRSWWSTVLCGVYRAFRLSRAESVASCLLVGTNTLGGGR